MIAHTYCKGREWDAYTFLVIREGITGLRVRTSEREDGMRAGTSTNICQKC